MEATGRGQVFIVRKNFVTSETLESHSIPLERVVYSVLWRNVWSKPCGHPECTAAEWRGQKLSLPSLEVDFPAAVTAQTKETKLPPELKSLPAPLQPILLCKQNEASGFLAQTSSGNCRAVTMSGSTVTWYWPCVYRALQFAFLLSTDWLSKSIR